MRFRPAAHLIAAGAGLVASSLTTLAARADIILDAPIIPTASIITPGSVVPTSYVVPTSTILPTSYVIPTASVVSTASSVYLPTSYTTTSYYRGGLFRPRRYVERTSYYDSVGSYVSPTSYLSSSILPTTYLSSSAVVPTTYVSSSIVPTTYVVPTVATSTVVPTTIISRPTLTPTSLVLSDSVVATSATPSVCCGGGESVVAPSVVESSPSDPTPTRAIVPRSSTAPRSQGNAVVSQPSTGVTASPVAPTTIPNPERAPSTEVNPQTEPVPAPAAPKVGGAVSPPEPATAPGTVAPTVPLDVPGPGDINKPSSNADPGPNPKADMAINRLAYRPTYTGTGMPKARNVLRGRVVGWRSNQPEEGVEIVITHATGAFRSRPALTDAQGEFSVSLPDGDWSVQVRMPSGSLLAAGQGVTATAGQVIDEASGQNVVEYLIRR